MVKIHCDKCENEIKEAYYYTVNICKVELSPQYDYYVDCSGSSSAVYREKSPYEQLKYQRMYCQDCVDKINKLI